MMDRVERNKEEGFRAELPPEIWEKIGESLPSRLDVAHFRSACKEWRSSLASPPRFPLPVLGPPARRRRGMIEVDDPDARYVITEDRFYAVTTTQSDKANRRMLVLAEGLDQGGLKFKPFPFLPAPAAANLPTEKVKIPQLSSSSFLSKFYDIRIAVPGEGEWTLNRTAYPWKRVVFISSTNNSTSLDPNYAAKPDITIVALYYTARISLLRLGDGSCHDPQLLNWKVDFCGTSHGCADIISYNGELVAVDRVGGAFVMDYHSLKMAQIAPPLFADDKLIPFLMRLGEASGELYLFVSDPNRNTDFDLKVYKLRRSEEVQQWHEVQDLGDQVFILCRGHCFSVARHVFAESDLMDLQYKSPLHRNSAFLVFSQHVPKLVRSHPSPHAILVFSNHSPHLAGTDSRICVIPIDSIPFHDVQVLPAAT